MEYWELGVSARVEGMGRKGKRGRKSRGVILVLGMFRKMVCKYLSARESIVSRAWVYNSDSSCVLREWRLTWCKPR